MSDPVFVIDAEHVPLMPISPAHARRLIAQQKAHWLHHHAFRILQLHHTVSDPHRYPCLIGLWIERHHVRCVLIAEGATKPFLLGEIVIDMHTDLLLRLRRRAHHRRRRHARQVRQETPKHSQQRMARPWQGTPYVQWRVQAIVRVVAKLRTYLPLTHLLIVQPRPYHQDWTSLSNRERRDILRYRDGEHCAYCGQSTTVLEIDHVIPRSRGGSDALTNLVLACSACNQRKGNRTPTEAGLELSSSQKLHRAFRQREYTLARQTAQLLLRHATASFSMQWFDQEVCATIFSTATLEVLQTWQTQVYTITVWIAKPIARLRQQRFYAHNYPLRTPTNALFVRIGTAVKRRVAVNQSIAIWKTPRFRLKVIRVTEPEPTDASYHIRRGMVGHLQQHQHRIRGIVGAIHSTGRITLLIPHFDGKTITWQRLTVSVRNVRIIGRDGVAFLKVLVGELTKE